MKQTLLMVALATVCMRSASAEEPTPLTAAPMEGPFASLEKYCKQRVISDEKNNETRRKKSDWIKDAKGDKDEEKRAETRFGCACSVDKPSRVVKVGALIPGVERASFLTSGCDVSGMSELTDTTFTLALKTERGWYTLAAENLFNRGVDSEVVAKSMLARRMGGTELLWTFDITGERGDRRSWKSTQLVIVGIGASGAPSATPILSLLYRSKETPDGERATVSIDSRRTITWQSAGHLTIRGLKDDVEAGPRVVVFP